MIPFFGAGGAVHATNDQELLQTYRCAQRCTWKHPPVPPSLTSRRPRGSADSGLLYSDVGRDGRGRWRRLLAVVYLRIVPTSTLNLRNWLIRFWSGADKVEIDVRGDLLPSDDSSSFCRFSLLVLECLFLVLSVTVRAAPRAVIVLWQVLVFGSGAF